MIRLFFLLSLPKSGLYLKWPSEEFGFNEDFPWSQNPWSSELQQKWPKHIPIMFLLVTTVTYLKNKVTVTGFSSYWRSLDLDVIVAIIWMSGNLAALRNFAGLVWSCPPSNSWDYYSTIFWGIGRNPKKHPSMAIGFQPSTPKKHILIRSPKNTIGSPNFNRVLGWNSGTTKTGLSRHGFVATLHLKTEQRNKNVKQCVYST